MRSETTDIPLIHGYTFGFLHDLTGEIGQEVLKCALEQADQVAKSKPSSAFRATTTDNAFFALVEGNVIGFAVLRVWEEENVLWLGMAWTDPQYRLRGIYRHLFGCAVRMAEAGNFHAVQLGIDPANEASIQTHLALGAKPTLLEVLTGGDTTPRTRMGGGTA